MREGWYVSLLASLVSGSFTSFMSVKKGLNAGLICACDGFSVVRYELASTLCSRACKVDGWKVVDLEGGKEGGCVVIVGRLGGGIDALSFDFSPLGEVVGTTGIDSGFRGELEDG